MLRVGPPKNRLFAGFLAMALVMRGLQALAEPHPRQPAWFSRPESQWFFKKGSWDSVGGNFFFSFFFFATKGNRWHLMGFASDARYPAKCGTVLYSKELCGLSDTPLDIHEMKGHLLLII